MRIDEKVSITLPEEFERIKSNDSQKITATTETGNIQIRVTTLPENLISKIENIDGLKYYADGIIGGMGFSNEYKIIKNSETLISGINARDILLQDNQNALTHMNVFIIDNQAYSIIFKENTSESETQREELFSSIQIN